MSFFLERLGVHLITPSTEPNIEPVHVDEVPPPTLPTISPLGFELTNHHKTQAVDVNAKETRVSVLGSFRSFKLLIADTATELPVTISFANNVLIARVQTVNTACSRLHAEDLSPSKIDGCNHEETNCDETHFASTSLLIETDDYIKCTRDEASFRVHEGCLFLSHAKKWMRLNVLVGIEDGFYTLNKNNF